MVLGLEAKYVKATDVGKKVMEKEPEEATEELTCDTLAATLENTGKHMDSF